jgi:hypothetical protein
MMPNKYQTRKRIKRVTIILATFFLAQYCLAQNPNSDNVSVVTLSDSLIKSEVALFTQKGAALKKSDSLSRAALMEIPIRSCSEKEVYLSWSTVTSSVSTFIHFYFKGESSDRILDSIFLVTHSHFRVKFPKSAFQGLVQTNSCDFSGKNKREKFFSPYFKAFYSQDKRRLYIYMLSGTDSNKYEVTWVIVNDRYYTRIVDSIP